MAIQLLIIIYYSLFKKIIIQYSECCDFRYAHHQLRTCLLSISKITFYIPTDSIQFKACWRAKASCVTRNWCIMSFLVKKILILIIVHCANWFASCYLLCSICWVIVIFLCCICRVSAKSPYQRSDPDSAPKKPT